LIRNPGVTVASREPETGSFPRSGHPTFDHIGEALGRQSLAAGVLDEGTPQSQFGSPGNATATVRSKPSSSLLTSSKPKRRKRISGLGKDNTSGSDGTVAREQLSGE